MLAGYSLVETLLIILTLTHFVRTAWGIWADNQTRHDVYDNLAPFHKVLGTMAPAGGAVGGWAQPAGGVPAPEGLFGADDLGGDAEIPPQLRAKIEEQQAKRRAVLDAEIAEAEAALAPEVIAEVRAEAAKAALGNLYLERQYAGGCFPHGHGRFVSDVA